MESETVKIRGDMIRLGQLLKLTGLIVSGAEVKDFLEDVEVRVNGARETRRGRQLHTGDTVEVGDIALRLVGS